MQKLYSLPDYGILLTVLKQSLVISVQASAGQHLLVSPQGELTAKAAVASESQHAALCTPLHYAPVPPSLSPCLSLSITLLPPLPSTTSSPPFFFFFFFFSVVN